MPSHNGLEPEKTMCNLNITAGTFALIPAGNCSEKWIIDNGEVTAHVYKRVDGFATVAPHGEVVDVYTSKKAAENAIDPDYQSRINSAMFRSGAL